MTTLDSRHRPYKVWSGDRQTRKGVVAGSLQELRELGGEKLGYGLSGEVRVVLESDGTEIEDDTYFQLVDKDTIFLLLRPGERWVPPGVEAIRAVSDEPDTSVQGAAEVDHPSGRSLGQILNNLRRDVANLVLLSAEQLQAVAEMDSDQIQQHSHDEADRGFLRNLREVCDRTLLERQDAQDAAELVKLLKHDRDGGDDVTDTSNGARKAATSSEGDFQECSRNAGFEAFARLRQWQRRGCSAFALSSSKKEQSSEDPSNSEESRPERVKKRRKKS